VIKMAGGVDKENNVLSKYNPDAQKNIATTISNFYNTQNKLNELSKDPKASRQEIVNIQQKMDRQGIMLIYLQNSPRTKMENKYYLDSASNDSLLRAAAEGYDIATANWVVQTLKRCLDGKPENEAEQTIIGGIDYICRLVPGINNTRKAYQNAKTLEEKEKIRQALVEQIGNMSPLLESRYNTNPSLAGLLLEQYVENNGMQVLEEAAARAESARDYPYWENQYIGKIAGQDYGENLEQFMKEYPKIEKIAELNKEAEKGNGKEAIELKESSEVVTSTKGATYAH
jgi:hypothetical protein